MFRGLINDAKSAVGSAVARYTTRAAVVGLFLLSLGFATAAITVQLVQLYGAINAYWMLAGGFTSVGIIAATIVGWKESNEEAVETAAVEADTSTVSAEAATQAAVQLPIALLGSVLTTPAGPASAIGLARLIGRNLSLVVLLALIALLFWPTTSADADTEDTTDPKRDARAPEPAASS